LGLLDICTPERKISNTQGGLALVYGSTPRVSVLHWRAFTERNVIAKFRHYSRRSVTLAESIWLMISILPQRI
jgi:hypothetical protein